MPATGAGRTDPPGRSPQRAATGGRSPPDLRHRQLADPLGGRAGAIAGELRSLASGAHHLLLNRPRYAEIADDATLLVVDSGNSRVLASDPQGNLFWELAGIPGSPLAHLNQPRWAQLLSRDEVVVSDHSNHRIVQLARRAAARD